MSGRHIVAMGGGQSPDDPMFEYVMSLVDRPRPRVCFLTTPAGDAPQYVAAFHRAFPSSRFEPKDLALYQRTVGDVSAFLLDQDVVVCPAEIRPTRSRFGACTAWTWPFGGPGRPGWSFRRERGRELLVRGTTDAFGVGRADPLRDGLGSSRGASARTTTRSRRGGRNSSG